MAGAGLAVVDHPPRGLAGAEEDAADVDGKGVVPDLYRDIQGGPLPADAGVVDHDRDRSQGGLGGVQGRSDRLGVRYVQGEGPRRSAGRLYLRDGGLQAVGPARHQGHRRAGRGQDPREMQPKAAGGPRHDRDTLLQLHVHRFPSAPAEPMTLEPDGFSRSLNPALNF